MIKKSKENEVPEEREKKASKRSLIIISRATMQKNVYFYAIKYLIIYPRLFKIYSFHEKNYIHVFWSQWNEGGSSKFLYQLNDCSSAQIYRLSKLKESFRLPSGVRWQFVFSCTPTPKNPAVRGWERARE